jgi:hypothetical protein
MNTFPDSVQSSLTPMRVVRSSCWSGLVLVLMIFVIIVVFYGIIYYWEDLNNVIQIFLS